MAEGTGYQARLTTPSAWAAYAHLTRHFGNPVRIMELPDGERFRPRKVDVAQFSPLGDGSTALLATCGVSNTATPGGRFAELFLVCRPAPDVEMAAEMARLLRRVSLTSVRRNVDLQPGLLLSMPADAPALGRFPACILFPPLALVESFHVLEHKDGKRVTWCWVVPLFEREAALAREHGAPALHQWFAAEEVDLADLGRADLLVGDG